MKDFNRFIFNKTKNKNKKHFCRFCLQCFSNKKVLIEHRDDCLLINGKQNVKLESGYICFKNYSRQIPVPFKIYEDFECILKKVDVDIECSPNSSYTKKYQEHIPCSFAYKVVCVDNKFHKRIILYKEKDAVFRLIKSVLNAYNYCRSVMKKYVKKNVIVIAEEEGRFETSNNCWICGKLFDDDGDDDDDDDDDNKLRDHCHVTGKYRGGAHYVCNINLKISKKVLVILHNLKGYDSHLILKELSKFNNAKISVVPNGLEKYMAFTLNRNIVFIDSMQFMNSSLDSLVKHLRDEGFKYLPEKYSGEQLKLVKQKGVYRYEYINSFKRFNEDKLPNKDKFFSSLKDSGINEEQYDRAVNVWKVFIIKNLGEYHNCI